MDGISAALTIIGLVQVTAQVVQVCQTYYAAVRDARKDIRRLCTQLNTLQEALVRIADVADDDAHPLKLSISKLLGSDSPFVQNCKDDIEEILEKLEKKNRGGHISKFGLHALKWPFDSKEIDGVITTLNNYQMIIQTAIGGDLLPITRDIHQKLTTLQGNQEWRDIEHWLEAPDPSLNFQTARKRWQPGTSGWFVEGDTFREWTDSNTVLWLSGPPGCGKTILSSSIIDALEKMSQRTESGKVLGYFFFDYKDAMKRESEKCLRSLLVQLSREHGRIPASVSKLYNEHGNGLRQPGPGALLAALCNVCELFKEIFLVLDALDECLQLQDTLEMLVEVSHWPNVHILMTSRRMQSIADDLEVLNPTEIKIQDAPVEHDIKLYVSHLLKSDPKLRKWPSDVQGLIQESLVSRAQGMFRWVACQLDTLRKCVKLPSLEQTLSALPASLDETYDRILETLESMYLEDSIRVLQWLAFSYRPLSLVELNDAQAIRVGDTCGFEIDQRLPEPMELLEFTSTLATVTQGKRRYSFSEQWSTLITFSHYSVKEYLISSRIKTRPCSVSQYALLPSSAHSELAKSCLTYLLQDTLQSGPCEDAESMARRVNQLPFLSYATIGWPFHVNQIESWDSTLEDLIKAILTAGSGNFISWVQLLSLRASQSQSYKGFNRYKRCVMPTPLYFASSFGLEKCVKSLLEDGADPNMRGGSWGGTPLHAAFFRGHPKIARMLLDAGGDPYIEDARGERPLELLRWMVNSYWKPTAEPKATVDGSREEFSKRSQGLLDILLEYPDVLEPQTDPGTTDDTGLPSTGGGMDRVFAHSHIVRRKSR